MKHIVFTLLLMLSLGAQAQVINVFGDSYVRNHRAPYQETWHYLAAEQLFWTYRNYGRNGSAVAFDRTKDGFGPKMIDRLKEMNDTADVVMVIAGHNDASLIEEGRGTIEDYRKALCELLDALQAKYPDARLCCVTPWHVARPYFKPVVKVLRRECKKRRIPLLDLYKDKTIDVENEKFREQYFQPSKNLSDHAHLNAEGHKLLVGKGTEFLRSVLASPKHNEK